MVALNTLGGIAGTAVAGFVLVPRIGLVHTLSLLAVGAGVVGVIAAALGSGVHKLARWAVPMVALLAVIAAALAPADRLATLLARARGGETVFYEEGRGATVAVVKQASATHTFNRLYIQGVSNSGDTMTSQRYMRLQALLPLIVHSGTPRSVLVIGLGTGITAGATLPYPGLEHRVVAELLPPVLRAVPQFQGNYGVAGDKRVDIRLRDGGANCCKATSATTWSRWSRRRLRPRVWSTCTRRTSTASRQHACSRADWSRNGCRCRRRTTKTRVRWCAASSTCFRTRRCGRPSCTR